MIVQYIPIRYNFFYKHNIRANLIAQLIKFNYLKVNNGMRIIFCVEQCSKLIKQDYLQQSPTVS